MSDLSGKTAGRPMSVPNIVSRFLIIKRLAGRGRRYAVLAYETNDLLPVNDQQKYALFLFPW
jgi:hypothetical protein